MTDEQERFIWEAGDVTLCDESQLDTNTNSVVKIHIRTPQDETRDA